MKKIKYLSLIFTPIIFTPLVNTSCTSITNQLNFNQSSSLIGNPEPINTTFNSYDHDHQLSFIQNFNNNVNFVINDFVNWIRTQIKEHFYNAAGTQYIDKYNGSITVNSDSSNSNKFNVSLMIDLLSTGDVVLKNWYRFNNEQAFGDGFKIPNVRYFNLIYTNKVLSISNISRDEEKGINYVKYSPMSGSENFSLVFKDDKLVPTEFTCKQTISFVELNTYTYQNWSFK